MLGWLNVCDPMVCPAASTRRAISGWAAAFRPISKNVALIPASARICRTRGVRVTCGLSSKVSAIWPAGSSPSVEDPVPAGVDDDGDARQRRDSADRRARARAAPRPSRKAFGAAAPARRGDAWRAQACGSVFEELELVVWEQVSSGQSSAQPPITLEQVNTLDDWDG